MREGVNGLKEKPFTRDIKGTLLGAIFEATRLRQILLHERAHSEVVAAAKKLIPATVVRTDYPTGEDSPTLTTHTLAHTHLVTLSTPSPLGTLRPRVHPDNPFRTTLFARRTVDQRRTTHADRTTHNSTQLAIVGLACLVFTALPIYSSSSPLAIQESIPFDRIISLSDAVVCSFFCTYFMVILFV